MSTLPYATPARLHARHSFRYLREASVGSAYALLLLILAVFAPRFFTTGEFGDVLVANAPLLVAATGMALVILTRQIDISIGSQLSLCCILAGMASRSGMSIGVVAVLTIGFGVLLGSINGVLVAGLNLPSIIATLATYVILYQAKLLWDQGETIQGLGRDFQWFGLSQSNGRLVIVCIAAVVFVLFALGMRYVAVGRAIYAVGSDQEAARLAGIRPRRVVFGVFALMGGLAALAGLLMAVRFPQVDPKTGEDAFELQAIAAVVVGGVAISGGRGTLAGVFVGVLLLGTIRSALVFLGSHAYWDRAIQGGIILVAVASDVFYRRRE
jgi:rhamnose transport system permease protein